MKRYIKASSYDRASIVNRLDAIDGIHLIAVSDEIVIFKDHNNKEYSIQFNGDTERIENLLTQLEANEEPYNLTAPEDITPERLATIVSQLIDIYNNDSIGGSGQLIKIGKLLKFYNLIR